MTALRMRPQSATEEAGIYTKRSRHFFQFKKYSSAQLSLNIFIFRFLRANFLLCYMIISYAMFPLTKHCHYL